jgi:hypothetical protein
MGNTMNILSGFTIITDYLMLMEGTFLRLLYVFTPPQGFNRKKSTEKKELMFWRLKVGGVFGFWTF